VKEDDELVAWEKGSVVVGSSSSSSSSVQAVRLGTVAQEVLAVNDDEVRINWGYAYLSISSSSSSSSTPFPQLQAGSGSAMRSAFTSGLPLPSDHRQPRASNDDTPALAGVLHGAVGGDDATLCILFSYDELRVMSW
jgi:hypothetical protein